MEFLNKRNFLLISYILILLYVLISIPKDVELFYLSTTVGERYSINCLSTGSTQEIAELQYDLCDIKGKINQILDLENSKTPIIKDTLLLVLTIIGLLHVKGNNHL